MVTLFKPTAKQTVMQVPVHSVRPNPHQPRKLFDAHSLDELSSSIRQYGVLQPISVRRLPGGQYELIAGERRLRAAMKAGLSRIPAIAVDMCDDDSAVVALIENVQRQDLSFLEEAEAYSTLLTKHGFTQEELAVKIGKNQSTVANKLRLLKLSPAVMRVISDEQLTERHARALLRLPDEETQLDVLKTIVSQKLNVKETDALIERMLQDAAQTALAERPKRVRVLKDVRIFLNTIRHAVSVMRDSGINAMSSQKEYDTYYEYTIKIPKNA